MQLKILEDKENKLLNRKEIEGEIKVEERTPSNNEVKKKLAEIFKTEEELIVVEHIYQEFGVDKAKVYAKIYKSKEDLNKIEIIKQKKKKEVKSEGKESAKEKKELKKVEDGKAKQEEEESKDKGKEESKK